MFENLLAHVKVGYPEKNPDKMVSFITSFLEMKGFKNVCHVGIGEFSLPDEYEFSKVEDSFKSQVNEPHS